MPFSQIANLGQYGVVTDLAAAEMPENAFTSANNVRFRRGHVEQISGYSSPYATFTDTPIRGLQYVKSLVPSGGGAPQAIWYAVTPTKAFRVTAGNVVSEITRESPPGTRVPYTFGSGKVPMCAFNNSVVFTNNADVPQYVANESSIFAPLPGWTSTWRTPAIRSYKNFLIALGINDIGTGNFPHIVRWSNAAPPGSFPNEWVATTTNKAGSAPVAEEQGQIVDGLTLSNSFIIYKSDSYYEMQFIGGNEVMRIQKIADGFGLISQNCVVEFPGGHFCLGNGDVYVHNGGQPTSVIDGKRKQELFAAIDAGSAPREVSYVCSDPSNQELWVCYAVGLAQPNKAMVWNWSENTWSTRDIPQSICAANGTVDIFISGLGISVPNDATKLLIGATSKLQEVGRASTFEGTNIVSTMARENIHFGDQLGVKTLRSFMPQIDTDPGEVFTIDLSAKYQIDGPATNAVSATFTAGQSVQISRILTGRYLGYSITYNGNKPWKLRSISVEWEPRGRY